MADETASIGIKMETDGIARGIKSLEELAARGPKVEKSLEGVADATKRVNDATNKLGGDASGLNNVGKGADDAARRLDKVRDASRQASVGIKSVGDEAGDSVGRVTALSRAMTVLSGALTVAGLEKFVGLTKDVTQAFMDASIAGERMRIGLDFASSRGSAAELEFLRGVTNRLGLEFYSTAQAYTSFTAAAKGTALEGEKTRAVFESVAKAVSVMGLSADQASGVLLALQQMVSKGTVQAEELRGQLGERLPGAFQIAAKAMGVTTAELGKMLEQGQVVADDFLPKFAKALETSLGDAPEKAANRLEASINRQTTAWMTLKQTVGDSGLSSFWAGQLDILADGMTSITESMEQAKQAGGGFTEQMLSGAKAALGFANPLNAFSYSVQSASVQLTEAEKRLVALKQQAETQGSNAAIAAQINATQQLINKLREAKSEQAAVTGVRPSSDLGGLVSAVDRYAGRADATAATEKAAAALLKETQAYQSKAERMAEVRKQGDALNKQLAELTKTGLGNSDMAQQLRDRIAGVGERMESMAKSTARGGAATKSAAEEGVKAAQTQITSIQAQIRQEQELIDRLKERGSAADKLTEGEKLAIKIQQELTGKLTGKARAQKEVALAAAQELAGLQKTRVAEEARAKAIEASNEAMLKAIDTQLKGADANREQTQSIRDQIDAIGKSKTEVAAAALAREMAEFERAADSSSFDPRFLDAWLAKLKEGEAAIKAMRGLDFAEASYGADEMRRSLELGVQYAKQDLDLVFLSGDQRERVVAMREIERDLAEQIYKIDKMSISEAEKQTLKDKAAINARLRLEQTAAKQVSDSWQKTADTINESLTDALLRGFEDGKGFAENFRDTLKNMINTLVLKPVISFIVNPIGNVVSTLINGALGSLTNGVLGNGSTLGSLINNASSAYSALTGNNPVLNAAANWLGLGGSSILSGAFSSGAAGYGTLGLGGTASFAPGAIGYGSIAGQVGSTTGSIASTSGMGAGSTSGLGNLAAAWPVAAVLGAAFWGMSSMPSRPDYSGYASASSDPTRDAAAPTASGLTVDIANGIIPSLEALQAALADSTNGLSINEQYSLAVGPEDRLTWAGAPDLIGALERAGVTFADDLSREYLQRMSRGDQVFYTGEGYVDPATMWRDGESSGMRDFTYSAEMTQWGRQVAQSILGQLESVADVFDIEGDFSVIAGLRDEAKRDLLYAGLRIQQGDETLVDFEGKVGEGGTQEALRQFAAQTLEAFKGLDLPEWATNLVTETQTAINELDAEELGDKLGQTAIDSLNAVQAALVQTARVLDQLSKSVLEFGGYSQDVIYQITSLMGGVDSFNSVYSAYVQAFYSEQEQLDLLQRQLQEQFGALNVTMPSTIEGFRSLVESLDLNDEASRSLFASLLSISPQFAQFVTAMGTVEEVVEEVTKTVADLYAEAKSRTDGSFAAYQKNQQKVIDQWSDVQTAAEEAAEEARSIFDLLHDSVRELYGDVDSTRAMQADQGNAYISAALAAARATGILPDYEALSDAISGARGGLVSSGFDSKAEYEAAQLILAGRLSELEGYADSQLTEAERQAAYAKEQIDLINKEIALQQEMIAAIREGNEFQGTIAELAQAILDERAAKAALDAERAAAGNKGAGSGGLSFGVDGKFVGSGDQGKWFATRQGAEDELRRINAAGGYGYVRISGSGWEAFEMGSGFSEYGAIKSLADLIRSGASGDAVLEAAVGKQVSQLTRAMGFADDKAMADWLREQGYTVGSGGLIGPRNSFAVGTNFVPYDMVAQIHRGERIIPAADNSALIDAVNGRSGGMQAQKTEQQIATLQKGFSATVRELSDVKNLLKRLAAVSEATYQKA